MVSCEKVIIKQLTEKAGKKSFSFVFSVDIEKRDYISLYGSFSLYLFAQVQESKPKIINFEDTEMKETVAPV